MRRRCSRIVGPGSYALTLAGTRRPSSSRAAGKRFGLKTRSPQANQPTGLCFRAAVLTLAGAPAIVIMQ